LVTKGERKERKKKKESKRGGKRGEKKKKSVSSFIIFAPTVGRGKEMGGGGDLG